MTLPSVPIWESEHPEPELSGGSRPIASTAVSEEFSSQTKIRVLFVDDHEMIRQGLISMIADQPDIRILGEAANGKEALEMVRRLKPDVVVMDVSMPVMDGIEATRRIRDESSGVRVIGLSMYEDEKVAQRMLKAGAEAFITKTASSVELLKAIYGMEKAGGLGCDKNESP